jgi:hypothetical protein
MVKVLCCAWSRGSIPGFPFFAVSSAKTIVSSTKPRLDWLILSFLTSKAEIPLPDEKSLCYMRAIVYPVEA